MLGNSCIYHSILILTAVLDCVCGLDEVGDVVLLSCSAIADDVGHPGVVDDDPLVVVGDSMVACPVLLVGVCLLGPIESRRQLTLTTWSRKNIKVFTLPTVVY